MSNDIENEAITSAEAAPCPIGSEPPKVRERMERLFEKLDEAYPQKIVSKLLADHKTWAETASELAKILNYPNYKALLEAYGYKIEVSSSGRPSSNPMSVIDELKRRYPNGPECSTVNELKKANPDLASRFQNLSNQANKFFGMPFSQYLIGEGLLKGADDLEEHAAAELEGLMKELAADFAGKDRKPHSFEELAALCANLDIDRLAKLIKKVKSCSAEKYLISEGYINPELSDEELKENLERLSDELKKRYPKGMPFTGTMTQFKTENSDLPIKEAEKTVKALYGQSLQQYLEKIGVLPAKEMDHERLASIVEKFKKMYASGKMSSNMGKYKAILTNPNSLANFFSEEQYNEWVYNIKWKDIYLPFVEENPEIEVAGKSVVLSGVEESGSNNVIMKISQMGGIIKSSISSKIDYLVVNPNWAGMSKARKAIALQFSGNGIKIIDYTDIEKLDFKLPDEDKRADIEEQLRKQRLNKEKRKALQEEKSKKLAEEIKARKEQFESCCEELLKRYPKRKQFKGFIDKLMEDNKDLPIGELDTTARELYGDSLELYLCEKALNNMSSNQKIELAIQLFKKGLALIDKAIKEDRTYGSYAICNGEFFGFDGKWTQDQKNMIPIFFNHIAAEIENGSIKADTSPYSEDRVIAEFRKGKNSWWYEASIECPDEYRGLFGPVAAAAANYVFKGDGSVSIEFARDKWELRGDYSSSYRYGLSFCYNDAMLLKNKHTERKM